MPLSIIIQSIDIKSYYKTFYKINDRRTYVSILEAPLFVERFLKYLIVNHYDQYKNLCQFLVGEYIARNGYFENKHSSSSQKIEASTLQEINDYVSSKFWMSKDTIIIDLENRIFDDTFNSFVLFTENQISDVKNYINLNQQKNKIDHCKVWL